MVSVPAQRSPGTLSSPTVGARARRRSLIIAACVFLTLIVITLVVVQPWPDPNHETADHVVLNAGIPAGVTPGPTH